MKFKQYRFLYAGMLTSHHTLTYKFLRIWKQRLNNLLTSSSRGQIQRKAWCMGTYAGVDYILSLCPLQSRLQHIYQGQPFARVDLNGRYARVDFIPQPGTLDLASDQTVWHL
jgi:hypothetical protein